MPLDELLVDVDDGMCYGDLTTLMQPMHALGDEAFYGGEALYFVEDPFLLIEEVLDTHAHWLKPS